MRRWLGCAWLLLAACQDLPDLDAGVCGNHVIEAGEDCDGFDVYDGKVCRPPAVSNACHYDCAVGLLDEFGRQVTCPAGYGCDPDQICRKPTGAFLGKELPEVPGGVQTLMGGDFDGDRRRDVLALEAPRAFGLSKPSLHFFDSQANLRASWATTVDMASPNVARVSGDALDDIVFTAGGLVVMQGESNDTMTPLPRASYYLENARIHTIPAATVPVSNTTPVLLLHQSTQNLSLVRPDDNLELAILAELDGALDDLIGEPVIGNLREDEDESPCFDVSFALRGSPTIGVYQACRRDPDTGQVIWRDDVLTTTLEFDPPSTPVSAPIFADLDADGHLDVIVRAERDLYASYGDGNELGPLEPLELVAVDDLGRKAGVVPDPRPLAAGDFSGDGYADFVFPEYLLISVVRDGSVGYRGVFDAGGRPWTLALVADLNADGKLDAIAASAHHSDIDFFAGTGRGGPNPFLLQTIHPVTRMTVGDFDGDQVNDLAFVEPDAVRVQKEGEAVVLEDQMSVAFGNLTGAPSAAIPIGHLADITELTGISDAFDKARTDLMVVQDVDPNEPDGPGSSGTEAADGPKFSSLSLIFGSGDRTFYAPTLVSNFAVDGTLEGADAAVYVTTGHFATPERLDATLLGVTMQGNVAEYSFWYLPQITSSQTAMRRLDFPLELPFEPLRDPTFTRVATLRAEAADMDGDGTEELVVAGPSPDRFACLLQVTKFEAARERIVTTNALSIADGCSDRPQFQTGDFDADGHVDLAILTGSIDNGGHVRLLWNDGSGQLAESGNPPEDPFLSSDDGEPIRSFAFFQELADARSPYRVAYVTPRVARILELRGRQRQLVPLRGIAAEAPGTVAVLRGGATSLVAEDVSGDGVTDLVIADDGDVYVYRAELVQ